MWSVSRDSLGGGAGAIDVSYMSRGHREIFAPTHFVDISISDFLLQQSNALF